MVGGDRFWQWKVFLKRLMVALFVVVHGGGGSGDDGGDRGCNAVNW